MYKFNQSVLLADVRKKKIENNLSQDKLVKEIGISRATFNRLETKVLITLNTLCKICAWLEVSPQNYFTND